jgi:hypothetical protein
MTSLGLVLHLQCLICVLENLDLFVVLSLLLLQCCRLLPQISDLLLQCCRQQNNKTLRPPRGLLQNPHILRSVTMVMVLNTVQPKNLYSKFQIVSQTPEMSRAKVVLINKVETD